MPVRGFSESMRSKPVCGIVAVAVCANVSFQESEAMARATFKGKRFTGAMADEQIRECLANFGVTYRHHLPERKMALKTWLNMYAKAGVTYMFFVSKHVITVKDWVITDQNATARIEDHWCGRKFVQEVMEIV